jgi:beta-glucosidase
VNYYMTLFADGDDPFETRTARDGERLTQMGWGVHPEGLTRALRRVAAYGRPVYVTENGCATDDEAFRVEYLARHLAAVHAALAPAGRDADEPRADVRGYFHWTGVDNFEWARGWAPRFGLIAFDPETFDRTVKEGGRFYAAVAGDNALAPAHMERFGRP